jgi:hypothetical protein
MMVDVFCSFVVNPEVEVLAKSGSAALVAAKALLLKRTRLKGIGPARAGQPTEAIA